MESDSPLDGIYLFWINLVYKLLEWESVISILQYPGTINNFIIVLWTISIQTKDKGF